MYWAHRAVVFAIARLSCFIFLFYLSFVFFSVMLMSVPVLCIFCLLSVICCHTLTNKDLYISISYFAPFYIVNFLVGNGETEIMKCLRI